MKIIFFWSFYEHYLDSFYKKNPGFSDMPYRDQYALLLDDYFGVPGSYTRWAKKLGHEALLVINNCEPLQLSWARENDVAFADNWQKDVALEQIKRFKPDYFLMGSMFNLYGDFLDKVKKYAGKTMGWIACPIPTGIKLNQMDLILTSSTAFVDNFRKNGINSELLLPVFDPDILDKLPSDIIQDIDVSFIGGISPDHKKRQEFLEEIAQKAPLKFWGYWSKPTGTLARIKRLLCASPLEKCYKSELWGMEMYHVLKRSEITLNSHIDVAGNLAGNMRMFEATGCGTMLLTENKSNLADIFIPGKEVVAYDSTDEAIDKIKYYLTHEEERTRIAKAGQKRTLESYNYANTVKQMINYFNKYN